MYVLFAAPPDRDLDWQEDGVAGVSRFLGRVYRLVMRYRRKRMPRPARTTLRWYPPLLWPRRCCVSCTRRYVRSPRILPAVGTSTPASLPSWSWSTRSPQPSPALATDAGRGFGGVDGALCCAALISCLLYPRLPPTLRPNFGAKPAGLARCFVSRGRALTPIWLAKRRSKCRCRSTASCALWVRAVAGRQ